MNELNTEFNVDILSYLYDGGQENLRWVSLLSGKCLVILWQTTCRWSLYSVWVVRLTIFVQNIVPFQSLRPGGDWIRSWVIIFAHSSSSSNGTDDRRRFKPAPTKCHKLFCRYQNLIHFNDISGRFFIFLVFSPHIHFSSLFRCHRKMYAIRSERREKIAKVSGIGYQSFVAEKSNSKRVLLKNFVQYAILRLSFRTFWKKLLELFDCFYEECVLHQKHVFHQKSSFAIENRVLHMQSHPIPLLSLWLCRLLLYFSGLEKLIHFCKCEKGFSNLLLSSMDKTMWKFIPILHD